MGFRGKWITLWSLFGVLSISVSGVPLGTNDSSRFATIEALVESHTYDLKKSRYDTIDKAFVAGRNVSNKAPLFSVILSGIYACLYSIGITLQNAEGVVIRTLILCGVTLPCVSAVVALEYIMQYFGVGPESRVLTVIAFGFGSLNCAYGASLNSHVPAETAAIWAIIIACRSETSRGLAATGVMAGLACAIDPASAVVAVSAVSIIMCRFGRSGLVLTLMGMAVPLMAHVIAQNAATGTLMPPFRPEDLINGPKSYWAAPRGIDATADSPWLRMVNNVIGHHGLLLVCPFVGAGVGYLSSKRWSVLSPEARIMTIAGFGSLIAVALFSPCYGGICFGPRFIIPALPILFAMAGSVYRGAVGYCVGWVLALIGIIQCISVVRNPWIIAPAAYVFELLGLEKLDGRF